MMHQLTDAEIDALEGRELDVAVALYVFGQDVTHGYQWSTRTWQETPADGTCVLIARCETVPERVPAYSTTWAGMGLVIEALARRKAPNGEALSVDLMICPDLSSIEVFSPTWDACTVTVTGPPPQTAFTAVARAALKAAREAHGGA